MTIGCAVEHVKHNRLLLGSWGWDLIPVRSYNCGRGVDVF